VARAAEAAVIGDLLQLWLGKDKIGYRNGGVYPPTSCIGVQTPTSVYESELRCSCVFRSPGQGGECDVLSFCRRC
jgi:hypothetical protein